MVEVLIEDLGYDELGKPVVEAARRHQDRRLRRLPDQPPVRRATASPSRTRSTSTSWSRPWAATPLEKYEQKVTCCGGALAFSEPEKSQAQIKKIIESAYDHGADMIVTPCPVCQMNVEVYQGQINKKYGTKFKIPVVYYSQLMAVAYGATAKEAGSRRQHRARHPARRDRGQAGEEVKNHRHHVSKKPAKAGFFVGHVRLPPGSRGDGSWFVRGAVRCRGVC